MGVRPVTAALHVAAVIVGAALILTAVAVAIAASDTPARLTARTRHPSTRHRRTIP